MALARSRRERGIDYWPGFVDALSTLILGIVFLLSVFVVVQFFLSQEVTGKDTALQRLNAQLAQLTEMLSLEKVGKANLEDTLASLRANLATSRERARPAQGPLRRPAERQRPGERARRPARRAEGHRVARDGAGRTAQPADRRAAPPACCARKRAGSVREQGQGIAGAARPNSANGSTLRWRSACRNSRASARSSSAGCARSSATGRRSASSATASCSSRKCSSTPARP